MGSVHISPCKTKIGVSYKTTYKSAKKDPVKGSFSRTFGTKQEAEQFSHKLKQKIKNNDFSFMKKIPKFITVREGLFNYLEYVANTEELILPKNMPTILNRFSETSLAELPIDLITAKDVSDAIRQINEEFDLAPSTLSTYISHLSTAFNDANTLLNLNFNLDSLSIARKTLQRHKIIGSSNVRDRTMSEEEFIKIMSYYNEMEQRGRSKIPMADIIWFALYTCMRLSEICGKIKQHHFDESTNTLSIHDRKNPRNHKKITKIMLNEVTASIIKKMPKGLPEDPIFPFNPQSVSTSWAKATSELGIPDLHFHDLRACGSSHLFQLGMDIFTLSKLTGHSSAEMLLKRYLRGIPVQLPSQAFLATPVHRAA
ncbi:site-specific integrase [Shewanella schlegeliana]|uniref:Site-specific integrase n=2 Tax=Shewanella schlegeliana TaxID=190308 RepID=A0ABS1SW90_9GAMM|nr:site-specific integrase [Shewanella schlegeliana]MBL4912810.1 site-specific integrase [Shewanella schlegeliana]MCL1109092.1 site-specific integrase [Shewanella schlegeliana]GIU23047.1 integrase [Shewanella schlegeliana]